MTHGLTDFFPLSAKPALALVLGLVIAALALAIAAGPDMNWDLRNYHYYIGAMQLHGGFDRHLFPAQLPTYFNPTLDVPLAFMLENFPPMAVALTIAAVQCLNIPLLFIISRQVLARLLLAEASPRRAWLMLGAAVVIGVTGSMTRSEIGTSMGDLVVSVPLLAALACLGRAHPQAGLDRNPDLWIVLGGFAFGVAAGLKPVAVVFAPGFALVFLWLGDTWLEKIERLVVFGLAAAVGVALSAGWWAWEMWQTTRNPVFPLMNSLFRSPLYDAISTLEQNFRPHSVVEAITYPFRAAFGQSPGGEAAYVEPRYALVILLLPALFVRRPLDWAAALLGFFIAGFLAWLMLFGIERYAVALEMLSGPVIVLLAGLAFSTARRFLAVIALTVLALVATIPADWGHGSWKKIAGAGDWFGIKRPVDLGGADQMFLIIDNEPVAFVIPEFAGARFVRVGGWFDPSPGTGLDDMRRRAIADHAGPIYTIGLREPDDYVETILAGYGLRRTDDPCRVLETNPTSFKVCPVRRVARVELR